MTPPLRQLLSSVLLAGVVAAAESTSPVAIQPFPSVVQYAAARALPLENFELAPPADAARPGDRLIVLFTVEDGTTSRQWLGEFRAASLTAREAQSKPGTGLGVLSLFQSSLKTDTGHEYRFAQLPAALEIRIHGPFGNDQPSDKEPGATAARVLVTRDYLVHGLAPMAEIELRLRAAGKKYPDLSFLFRPKFSRAQIAAARARAAEAGFTEADERAYAEGYFALIQFANLAFRTNGVAAITREIADAPTLFSGAFVNLDWSRLQVEDSGDWRLAGARVFGVPYNFRSKTPARGWLVVTAARAPLQNMAGIVGLTVDWTAKAPGKRLIVRVLSGQRGAAREGPASSGR